MSFSWIMLIFRSLHLSSRLHKIIPKNLKGKSSSSQEWLTRQLNDPYVKRARELNLRARSAFKLIEMDEKITLLKPGMNVVECGAAPGAWSQVVLQKINSKGKSGKIVGIDLLPIVPLPGAIFLMGDFTLDNMQLQILSSLIDPNTPTIPPQIDVVLSDMAPNATGDGSTNHQRIIRLARKALTFAVTHGKIGGHFLTKIWDGSETNQFEKEIEQFYAKVSRLKPNCSRADSAEIFLFGKSKKS